MTDNAEQCVSELSQLYCSNLWLLKNERKSKANLTNLKRNFV